MYGVVYQREEVRTLLYLQAYSLQQGMLKFRIDSYCQHALPWEPPIVQE